jgi:hypothetical protein
MKLFGKIFGGIFDAMVFCYPLIRAVSRFVVVIGFLMYVILVGFSFGMHWSPEKFWFVQLSAIAALVAWNYFGRYLGRCHQKKYGHKNRGW